MGGGRGCKRVSVYVCVFVCLRVCIYESVFVCVCSRARVRVPARVLLLV